MSILFDLNETCQRLLDSLANCLFAAELPQPEMTSELRREAMQQAVFSLIPLANDTVRYTLLSQNMQVHHEHQELHDLMVQNGIPYVILKGSASARYYPEPLARMAGDVDFLVPPANFEQAREVLISAGFSCNEDNGGNHVAFHRPPKSIWELHRCINGGNEKVDKYLSNVIETAVEADGIMVPSDFHHCLILLCHMAVHMTSEGIGLRHLCDWAVFANRVDVSRWENELKDCGLWHFARVMSRLSAEYLHLPAQPWFGESDKDFLAELMMDILNGGNFGKKDVDRYRQIKYIHSADEQISANQGTLPQIWSAVKNKAKRENKSCAGVIIEYLMLLVLGKRKPDTTHTVSEAMYRRNVYAELKIFKTEE